MNSKLIFGSGAVERTRTAAVQAIETANYFYLIVVRSVVLCVVAKRLSKRYLNAWTRHNSLFRLDGQR